MWPSLEICNTQFLNSTVAKTAIKEGPAQKVKCYYYNKNEASTYHCWQIVGKV